MDTKHQQPISNNGVTHFLSAFMPTVNPMDPEFEVNQAFLVGFM